MLIIPRTTVNSIVKKFKNKGYVEASPRSGRPKLLNDRKMRKIVQKVSCEPSLGSRDIAESMAKDFGLTISPRTVRNYLQKANLRAYRKVKKPILTNKMKRMRLDWCRQFQGKPASFWRSVIFSDESYIQVFSGQANFARRPKGAALSPITIRQTPKHPKAVMIWGCFSYSGPGRISVVKETMKTENYIQTLSQKLIPSARDMFGEEDWIFQDDNASCHRSIRTKNWLRSKDIRTLPWPGNSPDLNPIENLWAILKEKVRKHAPNSETDLIAAIIKVWNHDIDHKIFQNLVDSMPKRIAEVIRANGGHSKY